MPTEQNRTVAEVLAGNVRAFRLLRGLDQGRLARRMQSLGHAWRQVTVSEVERDRRNVTAPELVALTMALGATVEQLLDPRGPERRRGPRLALSDWEVEITGDTDDTLLTRLSPVIPERRMTIQPEHVTGLVCSHRVHGEVVWDDHDGLRAVEWAEAEGPTP